MTWRLYKRTSFSHTHAPQFHIYFNANSQYRGGREGPKQPRSSSLIDGCILAQGINKRSTAVVLRQRGKAAFVEQTLADRRGNRGAVLSDKAQRQVRLRVGR